MPFEINPDYHPHRHQIRLHNNGARFLCAAAGVRGGKTKAGAAEFTRRITRDVKAGRGNRVFGSGRKRRPRLHYWVVSPTGDLIKEPIRYLFESIPPQWIERYYADDNSLWLVGDILIEFKGADRPQNLVSVGLNGLWIDEAARLKPDAWRGNLRPRLTDKAGWALFTTTPLGRNWLWEDVVSRGSYSGPLETREAQRDYEDYATVAWRTVDNDTIPRVLEEAAQAKRDLPKRYYLREYEASFEAFVGTVYDAFTVPTHVTTEAALRLEYGINGRPLRSLFRRVVAGIDHGWNAPGCILVVGDTGRELVVLEEDYATNRVVFDNQNEPKTWIGAAKRLRAKWGVELFVADPAEPRTIFEYQRCGLPVVGANNELLFGIRKVSEQMQVVDGKPRLRYLATCTNLIRETQGYQWDTHKKSGELTEIPAERQSDHALDPLRYVTVELRQYEEPVRDSGWGGYRQAAGPIS